MEIPTKDAPSQDALATVRDALRHALGRDMIASLHKENRFLDALAVGLSLSLFAAGIYLLGTLPLGPLWLLLFVLQGFLLQLMGLVSHDLFVHRQVWGRTGSWLGSIVLTLPRLSPPTGYQQAHLAHHRWIGTERDTEAYKQQLDTAAKRWLFLSLPGVKLAQAGKLKNADALRHYHDVSGQGELIERRARIEKILLRAWVLTLPVLIWLFPEPVFYGYLLPVLVMGPIVNTLRIIIEHADADPANPWHWSTWYRTGPISRVLFFWDSGDCHVIHHIYPRLPFYRMARAVTLMEPIVLAHGVTPRDSYWPLLKGWLLDIYPHRSVWPLSAHTNTENSPSISSR